MEPLGVVPTAHLFPGLHRHLIELLRALEPQDWARPTMASRWTVRDVAAHLLDSQIRRLSFQRDGHPLVAPDRAPSGYGELVTLLNDLNADWVRAARRFSPQLLVEFLAVTGPQVAELFASLDPHGQALFPVAWADESESEHWFDVGREYTEWWHHQAQLRAAVGAPPLTQRDWLHPFLEISVKAFRRAFREAPVGAGAAFVFQVDGEAGGTWSALEGAEGWSVFRGEASPATARARCDADTAWRLFFNALSDGDARRLIEVEGAEELITRLYSARAVMV